jgi:hypothetical protein
MFHSRRSALLRSACVQAASVAAIGFATACSAVRNDTRLDTSASVAVSRWVGPTDVPIVVASTNGSRDLAVLRAVFSFWGRSARAIAAAFEAVTPRAEPDQPLLAGDLERFARAAGLTAFAFHGTFEDVVFELRAGRPVIVGIVDEGDAGERRHFEVVLACEPAARRLRSLDPARGVVERSYNGFQDEWQAAAQVTLVMFASDAATDVLSSTASPKNDATPASSDFVAARPSRDASSLHPPCDCPSQHVAQR